MKQISTNLDSTHDPTHDPIHDPTNPVPTLDPV